MDEGHELTEKELQKLEKRITAEYRQAAREVAAKYEAWNAKFAAADAKQQAKLAAGEISKADYQQWVLRQRMIGSDWKTMSDILAKDLVNADNIARKMIGEEMPNVYALNANYGTYQIEHTGIDTGFTLYNHGTAEVLLKQENIALMPGPAGSKAEMLREAADLKWNRQKINSAVLQGVLQGEGAKKVAQRLMGVAQMDANAAIRYARTMTTSAQNAGRYQSYRRAKALGIDLTIEWQATLDNRTRHEHRMMHGQRREVDEPFEVSGFKILYPAEAKGKSSDIPQSMIWNCRCTLLAWVKGFEPDTVKSSPKMQGMSFEEWQTAKAPKGISDKLRAANMTKSVPKFAVQVPDNAEYASIVQTAYSKGNPTVKRLWEKNIPQEGIVSDFYFAGRENYNLITERIQLNVARDIRQKGVTYFHEHGHAIDNFGAIANGGTLSEHLSENPAFIKALRADLKTLRASKGSPWQSTADKDFIISMELCKKDDAFNGVSDILDGLTKGKASGKYGHAASYWREDKNNVAHEAFAHMTEAAFSDECREAIVEYFPTAWETYLKIVEDAL